MNFPEFFECATGHRPYGWQCRLADGEGNSRDGCAGLSPEEASLVAELVADGLSIQDRFRPEPFYRTTGMGHFESRSVEEIAQAKMTNRRGAL